MPVFRDIARTERFERELQDIEKNPRRADEFTEAVEWTLARDPSSGTQISENPSIWFIPMVDIRNGSSVAIYYTFDRNKVWLLSIYLSHFHEVF